jgi:hypothetical protein
MSKVLIPNFIITRDYDAMVSIFSADKYIDQSKLKSDNKLFFLSANKNKYLTSFEYDLCFNSNSEKFFKINFIDSDGNFESEFLQSSFFSKFVKDLAIQLSTIKETGEALSKVPELNGKIYIAFGIGDDLSNWSEPHVCEFRNAQIQIDASGRRIYSFGFFPSNDPIFRRQFIYDTNQVNYQSNFSYLSKLKYILNVDFLLNKDYKNISYTIRNLLRNYLKSSCNTQNILILLPDVDNADYQIFAPAKDYQYYQEVYSKIYGLDLTTGLPLSKVSLKQKASKLNSSAAKIRRYKSQISQLNKELEEVKINQITRQENKLGLIKFQYRKFVLNGTIRLNADLDSRSIRNYYIRGLDGGDLVAGESRPQRIKALNILSEINQVEDEILVLKNKLKEESNKQSAKIKEIQDKINALQKEIDSFTSSDPDTKQALADMLIDSTTKLIALPNATIDFLLEQSGKVVTSLEEESKKSYLIRFQDYYSRKSSLTPNTFDWYQNLNRLFQGIGNSMGLDSEDSVPYLYEETDIKLLNLWYNNGIIPNKTDRCVVLGVKSLINNYLYRNAAEFDKKMTTESTFEFSPKYKLEDEELTKKLMTSNYPAELFQILSKKKNSSAFSEQIILDELAVNPTKNISNKFLKFLGNSDLLKLSDTPIFTNNLKNSNVKSIEVQNLEGYWQFMNFNVKLDYSDELLLNSKSQYEKSTVYKSTKKDFDLIISEVIKQVSSESATQEFQAFNETFKNAINRLNLKTKTKNLYIGLIDKLSEIKQKSGTKFTTRYQQIFVALSSKVLNTNPTPDFGEERDFISDIEGLSLVIESLLSLGKVKTVDNKPTITLVEQDGLRAAQNIKASLFQYLYTHTAPTVTIRTLPFFNLSNNRTIIGKTAILLSKRTISQVSPINSQLENLENSLDFFSGVYNIIGAKHIITTSDCYSEFVMKKIITETIT